MPHVPQSNLVERLKSFAAPANRSVSVLALNGISFAFSSAADVRRPAASLIKLPIVMAVLEAASIGRIDLKVRVKRDSLGRSAYPTVMEVFDDHHAFSLAELCGLSLAVSDNLAATYLLELVGIPAVRDYLDNIGCHSTTVDVGFRDAMLPQLRHSNYTTARDVASMLLHIRDHAALSTYMFPMLRNGLMKSRIGLRLPEDLKIANKTGSLEGVVNDAGIVSDESLEVLFVFLSVDEHDTALTAIDVGNIALEVWRGLGGRTADRE